MLSELIYLSFRSPKCSDEDIYNILKTSVVNNAKQGVTGVLVYSKTKFLQVLEGDKGLVLDLYDKVKLDTRHRQVIILSLKPIHKRHFSGWQMVGKEVDMASYDFLTVMTDEEKVQFKSLLRGENQHNAVQMITKLFGPK